MRDAGAGIGGTLGGAPALLRPLMEVTKIVKGARTKHAATTNKPVRLFPIRD